MAYLRRLRKVILVQLAIEMEIDISESDTIKRIADAIESSDGYDEITTKAMTEGLIVKQEREEKLRVEEQEREEKLRVEKQEREEKLRVEALKERAA